MALAIPTASASVRTTSPSGAPGPRVAAQRYASSARSRSRARARARPPTRNTSLVRSGELALVLVDEVFGRGLIGRDRVPQRHELLAPLRPSLGVLHAGEARDHRVALDAQVRRADDDLRERRAHGPARAVGPGDLLGAPAADGGPGDRSNATTATAAGRHRLGAARPAPSSASTALTAATVGEPPPRARARRARRRTRQRRRPPSPAASAATSTTGRRRSPRTNASSSTARVGPSCTAPAESGHPPSDTAIELTSSRHEIRRAGPARPAPAHLRVGRLELLHDQDPTESDRGRDLHRRQAATASGPRRAAGSRPARTPRRRSGSRAGGSSAPSPPTRDASVSSACSGQPSYISPTHFFARARAFNGSRPSASTSSSRQA